MMNQSKSAGPDPAVQEAIDRLSRSELSPLEEQMFLAWATANQIDDPDNPEAGGVDLREIYQQTEGKVLPPGQLKAHVEKASAIDALMKAQEAHDQMSPIKMFMEAMQQNESPIDSFSGEMGGETAPEPSGPGPMGSPGGLDKLG